MQIKEVTIVLEIISIECTEYTELEHSLQKIIAAKVKMYSILDQAAVTLSTGGLNNRNLFRTVLESEKFNIKVLVNSGPGEGSCSGLYPSAFSLCTHITSSVCAHMERENQQALWCLFF